MNRPQLSCVDCLLSHILLVQTSTDEGCNRAKSTDAQSVYGQPAPLSQPTRLLATQVSSLQSACTDSAEQVPTAVRTGLRGSSSLRTEPAAAPGTLAADPLRLLSTDCASWRARYRCGMAALLLQPSPLVAAAGLPEVLLYHDLALEDARVRDWNAHRCCLFRLTAPSVH